VQRAQERLFHALARLEEAAAGADARHQQRLRELQAVRAEADALREQQNALADRVAAAIGRLRSILGEDIHS
jgi:FtsZ-binding cell division protein ZapB